jgi:ankyrin repeat protein
MTLEDAFFDAIILGKTGRVRALMARDASLANERTAGAMPMTALELAQVHNRAAIVDILCKSGADVNARNLFGETACHRAAGANQIDVVAMLIAHHADLSIRDNRIRTPLAVAVAAGRERIAAMLIAGGSPLIERDVLCRAASMSVAIIDLLTERSVAVADLRDHVGNTPCHWLAITPFRPDVLNRLVRVGGVNLSALDNGGRNCVHVAAASGFDLQWLRLFIEAGVEFDRPDDYHTTPLHLACTGAGVEFVALLVAAGADVDARDRGGRSAIHCSAESLRLHSSIGPILQLLGAVGADCSPGNPPPLMWSSVRDRLVISAEERDALRGKIAATRLSLVRRRALQICVGLQSLRLDALQMCEILQQSCCLGRLAHLIAFHIWWQIATTVKHFRQRCHTLLVRGADA